MLLHFNTNLKSYTIIAFICLSGILFSTSFAHAAEPRASAEIILDDYPLKFPQDPMILNGTTMVPFRAIAESLGIQVRWEADTKTVHAEKESKRVELVIEQSTAQINGQPYALRQAPIIRNNHTLIPLRFFSEQFGASVQWVSDTKTVLLTSPPADLYTLGFYAIRSFADRERIDDFNSVAFGWSRLNQDGELVLNGDDYYWPQAAGEDTPESLIRGAADQGTNPYLMVYSGDQQGELTRMLQSPVLREQTIEKIIALLKNKSFGGVLLDFEGLGLSGDRELAQQEFNVFVDELDTALQQESETAKLAIALHPLNSSYLGYDYEKLGEMADELIVMAYAYEGENGPEPLDGVNQAIELALQQVSEEKLVLGISFGSEDADSVDAKIGLAKRHQLKGVAFWRLGLISEAAYQSIEEQLQS